MDTELLQSQLYNHTMLHPAGLLAVLLLGTLMALAPRRYALIPLLVMIFFVPSAQRIVALSLDFTLLRIMVLFGCARVLLRSEYRGLAPNILDKLVLAWVCSTVVIFTLCDGTLESFVNRLGVAYDAIGMYFIVRCLVRGPGEMLALVRGLALVILPVAAAFAYEMTSGRNIFAFLGGVPEMTVIRQGKLRCQGAFAHPLLAGTLMAALTPLILSLWWHGRRVLCVAGVAASVFVIYSTQSTTPLTGLICVGVVFLLFPLRAYTIWLWAGLGALLLVLHFLMNHPVWHLITRLDLVGGSTGYYRFLLIDEFFNRFDEWWLLGTRTTDHWWEWGMGDLANQYVLEGVDGGLLTLSMFLLIIALGYANIAAVLRRSRCQHGVQILAWALFASLSAHVVSFLGVSYFGQTVMGWYLTLGLIASLASPSPAPRTVRPSLAAGGSPLPTHGVLARAGTA